MFICFSFFGLFDLKLIVLAFTKSYEEAFCFFTSISHSFSFIILLLCGKTLFVLHVSELVFERCLFLFSITSKIKVDNSTFYHWKFIKKIKEQITDEVCS